MRIVFGADGSVGNIDPKRVVLILRDQQAVLAPCEELRIGDLAIFSRSGGRTNHDEFIANGGIAEAVPITKLHRTIQDRG